MGKHGRTRRDTNPEEGLLIGRIEFMAGCSDALVHRMTQLVSDHSNVFVRFLASSLETIKSPVLQIYTQCEVNFYISICVR